MGVLDLAPPAPMLLHHLIATSLHGRMNRIDVFARRVGDIDRMVAHCDAQEQLDAFLVVGTNRVQGLVRFKLRVREGMCVRDKLSGFYVVDDDAGSIPRGPFDICGDISDDDPKKAMQTILGRYGVRSANSFFRNEPTRDDDNVLHGVLDVRVIELPRCTQVATKRISVSVDFAR